MKQKISFLHTALILLFVLIFNTVHSQKKPIQGIKRGKDIVINKEIFSTQEGFIEVPEDWTNPSMRKLYLPVFIVKSNSKTPDEPIFWFNGGPGASNIRPVNRFESATPSKLLDNHDFVCIGYRGVDGTTVLKSKKINKAMKGLNHKMLSNESLNNMEAKIKEYQAQLLKDSIDINNYTMLDVIEDFEYARKFLGYKMINTLSISYGTRLTLLYSYKYPQAIKRTVMIGANPPGHFVWFPEKTEQILDIYDSIYKSQNKVDGIRSIKELMKIAFEKMPKRWSLFKLDSDKIKTGTFTALYSKDMIGVVLEGYLRAVNKGDYSYLYLMQKMIDMGASNLVFGEMSAKGYSADYQEDVDYRTTLKGESTVLGGNISMLYWGIAKAFKMKMIPLEYRQLNTSLTETLVISGDLDVSTPSDYARDKLMPSLKNGEQLILKNMSHEDIITKALKGSDFLSKYYNSGEVDKSEILKTENLNFKPQTRFSKLKIFAMGVIM
jgi:pimeloyl-ACP methyl ester carboxylesterase